MALVVKHGDVELVYSGLTLVRADFFYFISFNFFQA